MAAPTTTASGIVLILGSYTLTITRFGTYPGRYPRLEAEYTSINRSIRNSAARRGPLTHPPAIWTFDATLDLGQQETLRRMEALYWNSRTGWTIYDYTNYWSENGVTNTRAIAPNSTATNDGTTILYYPQWQAEPTQPFEFTEQSSGYDRVAMQFTETGVISA